MNKVEEAIKIVREFNKENKFRDCGKLNNAIDIVLSVAERHKDEEILLSEDEKKYLNKILDSEILKDVDIVDIYFRKHINGISSDHVIVNFNSDRFMELEITDHTHKYENIVNDTRYSLYELGLGGK